KDDSLSLPFLHSFQVRHLKKHLSMVALAAPRQPARAVPRPSEKARHNQRAKNPFATTARSAASTTFNRSKRRERSKVSLSRSPLFPSFTSVHIRLSQKISRQKRNGRKGRFAFSSISSFIPSETS